MDRADPAVPARPRLSVLIKALNEADKIERCLHAVRAATAGFDTEVILVDSNSEDATVAKALEFPEVTIVQFANAAERCCGAAVQLGYQYARGDWLYVLDGDMEMEPGFLERAFAAMQDDTSLVGVGGILRDRRIESSYDQRRHSAALKQQSVLLVDELGGGGLYRRSAVDQVGYLAHPGLKAYEEAELGLRLRSAGFRLARLPVTAVWHEGHRETNWQMLARLWRNGRAAAAGRLLRTAWSKVWLQLAVRKFSYLVVTALFDVLVLIIALAAAWVGGVLASAMVVLASLTLFVGVMAVRKRALIAGLWAAVLWQHALAAALKGLVAPALDDAKRPVLGIVVRESRL